MHPHAQLLERLYTCLDAHDHEGMAACYHPRATFEDIAFELEGKEQIHAMWAMIAGTDLRATFTVLHADDHTGAVDLVDRYTFWSKPGDGPRPVVNVIRSTFRFSDGRIIEHRDTCGALKWGLQALGPIKGVLSWLIPAIRRKKAKEKLDAFVSAHPEYAWKPVGATEVPSA